MEARATPATTMDHGGAGGGGASATLRKRALSVDPASSAPAAAAIGFGSEAAGGGGRRREEEDEVEEEEPVSPTGRLFREPSFRCHIVSVFGLAAAPVDLPALRDAVAATLARHPRFCSVQTVNDVLLGITSAALSRYYFRKTGERDSKSITVRSAVLVNLRPTPGIQALATMMESGKDNGARWGNKIGYMLIPFHLARHHDPIEYVRRAAKVARRKKSSMESVFTFWSGDMVLKLFGIKAAAALCYGMFTHTTLSFSNMVGPTEQVLFCGNPIVYIAPGTYGHPHALTIHYQSYMNTVKLVLSVDESQFPDCHQLLEDFAESLRLIRDAVPRKPEAEAAQGGAPS